MNEDRKERYFVINIKDIVLRMWKQRRLYFVSMPVTAVLAYLLILGAPRYYVTDTKLVPELGGDNVGGGLMDLASSFGLDLGDMQSGDAISPLLYPDLMDDNGFVATLFDVPVTVNEEDRQFTTTYYDYLNTKQRHAWWGLIFEGLRRLLPMKADRGEMAEFDPYVLSRRQMDVVLQIRDNIKIDIDKRTTIISVTVKDQNPYVARAMADTLRGKLQQFITKYRTSKATIDMLHYEKMAQEAAVRCRELSDRLATLTDRNYDAILQSVTVERERVADQLSVQQSSYAAMMAKYEAAKAKVQERTPAFTMLKGAEVPIKPAGPKRLIFALAMCFLVAVCETMYIFRSELKAAL